MKPEDWSPAEVVFMFAGYLSTMPRAITVGAVHLATPLADAAAAFINHWHLGPPRHGFADVERPQTPSATNVAEVKKQARKCAGPTSGGGRGDERRNRGETTVHSQYRKGSPGATFWTSSEGQEVGVPFSEADMGIRSSSVGKGDTEGLLVTSQTGMAWRWRVPMFYYLPVTSQTSLTFRRRAFLREK